MVQNHYMYTLVPRRAHEFFLMCPKMALQCQKMPRFYKAKNCPKIDTLVLKRFAKSSQHVGLKPQKPKTKLDLESNPTNFIKIQHQMKKKWLLKVSVIRPM